MSLDFDLPLFPDPVDLALGILKPLEEDIPGLAVRSQLDNDFRLPYLMVRSASSGFTNSQFGYSDRRFVRRAVLNVQTFTQEPDAEAKGEALHELVYHCLERAVMRRLKVPDVGFIKEVRVLTPAVRVPDWATATGVNQFANLMKAAQRYEATYAIAYSPTKPYRKAGDDLAAFISS